MKINLTKITYVYTGLYISRIYHHILQHIQTIH